MTRPEEGAAATAERLRALGHTAVVAPVLAVMPTGEPPPAGAFAAAVVTSASAVPFLAEVRGEIETLPIYAVGRRTAAAVSAAGFTNMLSGGGTGRDLAQLIARTLPPASALLHAAGRDRTGEPARSLRDAGYSVQVWECYEARGVDTLAMEAALAFRTGALDAVLHYSARTARHLASLACEAGLGVPLAALPHLCLSSDIAAALSSLAPARVLVAERPTEASLLALLASEWQSSGTGSRPPQSG